MILPASFGADWIMSHRKRQGLSKINPPLVEKMIHALGLLEKLIHAGLPFVFKGGTSLILLLKESGRFSIDIDIITKAGKSDIETALAKVCDGTPFLRYILQEHRSYKDGVPKAHYQVMYQSSMENRENHVLLDILFEDHSYPAIQQLPILSPWVKTDGNETLVNIPTVSAIAGDKLTAFAPNTTGILYGKGKQVEIVKQLHDINKLYDEAEGIATIRDSFLSTVQKEILYRGNQFTVETVLKDIVETGIMIARREKQITSLGAGQYKEIATGLLQLKAYLTSSAFRIDEAIVASAKAAVLSTMIQHHAEGALPRYVTKINKSDILIQDPTFNYLNKISVEALYYWNYVITYNGY